MIHKTFEFSNMLIRSLRFNEKKKENLLNGKLNSDLLDNFSIRGNAYEKLYYIALPQHVLRDVDFGNEHLHSLTISVKDENGDLFDFNGFRLKFELKINWYNIYNIFIKRDVKCTAWKM